MRVGTGLGACLPLSVCCHGRGLRLDSACAQVPAWHGYQIIAYVQRRVIYKTPTAALATPLFLTSCIFSFFPEIPDSPCALDRGAGCSVSRLCFFLSPISLFFLGRICRIAPSLHQWPG